MIEHDEKDDPPNDEAALASSSYDGRIWKKWNPHQGSSQLALQAFGVLYDAGRPLSRDELADQLLARLDVYAKSYLEAWWLHKAKLTQAKVRAHRNRPVTVAGRVTAVTVTPKRAVRAWLTQVFAARVRMGNSLLRDPDGRYRPGPTAPVAQTLDGTVVRYTPAKRQELAQAEADQGRSHLALIEWSRAAKQLDLSSPSARAQVLIFLTRRFLVGPKTTGSSQYGAPLNETDLRVRFHGVLRQASTPAAQRAVLEAALKAIWNEGEPQELPKEEGEVVKQ